MYIYKWSKRKPLHNNIVHSLLQVLFNLGTQYHASKSYVEALNTYLLIVKNKMFSAGGVCVCVCVCVHTCSRVPRPYHIILYSGKYSRVLRFAVFAKIRTQITSKLHIREMFPLYGNCKGPGNETVCCIHLSMWLHVCVCVCVPICWKLLRDS